MVRFNPGIYQANTGVIADSHNQMGRSIIDALMQRQQIQAAQTEAQVEKNSDPAYIISLIRQGVKPTPEQQAIVDIAEAKAKRTFFHPETGQQITSGGFPDYRPKDEAQASQVRPTIDPMVANQIAAETNPTERQKMIRKADRDVFENSKNMPMAGTVSGQKALFEANLALDKAREIEEFKQDLETQKENKSAVQASKAIKNTLDDLIDDPELGQISGGPFGLQGFQAGVFPVGRAQRRLKPKLDQLAGQKYLEAYQSLKGGGQITEFEGQKADAAQAAIGQSMDDADFKVALEDYRKVIENGIARLEGREPPHNFEEPSIEEGVTATNPQTGEKIIFRNGQWQPM